jgi:phytoene synthase
VLAAAGAHREDVLAARATPALAASIHAMIDHVERHMAETRARIGTIAPSAAPALLPLAVVRLFVPKLRRAAADPFRTGTEVAQWRRQWAMWRQARRVRP